MTKHTKKPRGRPPGSWGPSDTDIKLITRMAKAGMTNKMVSTALGVSNRTFYRSDLARETYDIGLCAAITQVGESVMTRIIKGGADTAMHAFVLKTRGGWKENDTFMNLKDFVGADGEELSLQDKLVVLDKAFSKGDISVNNYKLLSDAVSNRIKVDMVVQDIDGRLKALEGK